MLFIRSCQLLVLTCFLSSCVLTPLHYQNNTSPCHFDIATIPERNGQVLRNFLREKLRFVPGNTQTSPYHVAVKLTSSEASAGYNTDLTTTITRITFTAIVKITDKNMNEVTNFTAVIADSFINAVSVFAMDKARADTKRRILNALSNDISSKISIALRIQDDQRT